MQYKIVFNDNTNDLKIIPTYIDTTDMVGIDKVFETDESAKDFVKLMDSLFVASWMKDQKMFVRILNRLLNFK